MNEQRPPLHPQQPQSPQHHPQQPLHHPPQPPQIRPIQNTLHPGVPPAPKPVMPAAPKPVVPMAPKPIEDDPIELVEDDDSLEVTSSAPAKKIVAFGVAAAHAQREWKRKTYADGKGACRVRSFHAKYSEQGLEHLDDMINEWLDNHPEIEVKFTTTTVHTFEGKIREPALVVNVWY